ncbi:unnamed protein product [Prorocentrum cordatum]|uniref:Glycoside hydrolase family 5 domain-containing protein n=1 Tax=Prorocentrum cordatum TaxID=2364126 RepID=A0ABN9UFN6_9DINO|nr:unnamed protein product [Polarella glacialis]
MAEAAVERGPLLEQDGPAPARGSAAAGGGRASRARRAGAALLAVGGLAAALGLAASQPGWPRPRGVGAAASTVGLSAEDAEDPGRTARIARLQDMGAHRWGVNIHFTGSNPTRMAALAKAFKVIRIDMFWHHVESSKGKFDFKEYEELLADMEDNDVQPLFILCYGNGLYGCPDHPRTPSCQEAFVNYAAASMTHFAGHGIIWEVYNEPNGFWADFGRLREETRREYPALVNRVMQRVRGDPAIANETVIGPATSGVDVEFICATGNVGGLDHFDGISAHPYRREGPESVVGSWQELRHRLEGYPTVAKLPFVSSEWGWATCGHPDNPQPCPPGGGGTGDLISGAQQAARLARQWLINDNVGISFSIWYDWADDGTEPMNAEHNFGATYHDADYAAEPNVYGKPSYLAAMTLQSLLGSLVYVENLCGPDGTFCLRYRHRDDPDGKYDKYAVWTLKPHGLMTLSLPVKECMRVIGMLGENLDQAACGEGGCPEVCPEGGGGVQMQVSDLPSYLVPKPEAHAAAAPVAAITAGATEAPTPAPTAVPAAVAPTAAPTAVPTASPSAPPTAAPTAEATAAPAPATAAPSGPPAAAPGPPHTDVDVVRFLRSAEAADMRADRVAWLRSMGSRRWGVGVDAGTLETGEEAELASAFSTARVAVSWATVETEKGIYNFTAYDDVVGRLQGQSVQVVASLCCGSELYDCGSYPGGGSECRDAYVAYAMAAIAHFRGQNVIWEVFDEPNVAWAGGEGAGEAAAQYALLLDALGQAVRLDADTSNEILVGPATAGIDIGFISAVGDTAAFRWLDGISVKPAPVHDGNDGTFLALSQLARRFSPEGQVAPALLSTSSGWPACSSSLDQPRSCAAGAAAAESAGAVPLEEQAARLARQWLVHDACNVSVSLWPAWKDGGEGAPPPAGGYGVVLRAAAPLRPKPAYFAARALRALLGRKAVEASCSADGRLRCLAYAPAGGGRARSYAVWSVAADPPRGLALRLGACLAVVDMSLAQLGQLCPGQDRTSSPRRSPSTSFPARRLLLAGVRSTPPRRSEDRRDRAPTTAPLSP